MVEYAFFTPASFQQKLRQRDHPGFWLFVLMLCLLPIERLVFPFNLKIVDAALVLLILYGLAKAMNIDQSLKFPLLLPIWLVLLASSFAMLVGTVHTNGIVAVVQEIYLFVWFIVLTNLLGTFVASDIDRLMKVWSIVAVLEATATLMGMLRIGPRIFYTAFFYDAPHLERAISVGGFSRGVGTYLNPNAAAAYLSVSFFVLLATSWPRRTRVMLGGWLLLGLLGTGSMGALLSTVLGLVVLVVVYSFKWHRAVLFWTAFVSIGASVLALMVLVLSLWPVELSELGFGESMGVLALTLGRLPHSLSGRLVRVENAWSIYALHPWGTGPNSFESLELSVHNDYLAFLFERGPIGAVGWLSIVGVTLLIPLRAARRSNGAHQRWQVLALGAGFLACAINSLTHEVFHFRQMWLLMVFIFSTSYLYLEPFASVDVSAQNQPARGRRYEIARG